MLKLKIKFQEELVQERGNHLLEPKLVASVGELSVKGG